MRRRSVAACLAAGLLALAPAAQAEAAGTKVTVRGSEYGKMLWTGPPGDLWL